MGLYNNGFCPTCGTHILAYTEKVMNVINKAREGETITIVSTIEDCSSQRYRALRRNDLKLGPDAFFLWDAVGDHVLDYDYDWNESNVTEGTTKKFRVTITNYFTINPNFQKRRSFFPGIELVISENSEPYSDSSIEEGYNCSCPLCGAMTIKEPWNIEKSFLVPEQEKCMAEAENYVSNAESCVVYPRKTGSNGERDTRQYLDLLIGIETELIYYTKQLGSLLTMQKETGRMALKERCWFLRREKEATLLEVKKCEKELAVLDKKYPLLSLSFQSAEFGLYEPKIPEYKKPGLFNKKKVEAENQQMKAQYEDQLAAFQTKWVQLKLDETNRRSIENDRITEKRRSEQELLERQISDLKQRANSVNMDLSGSGLQKADAFCLSEIADVQEIINQLCDARAQLLSVGIIYPKYLDIVALTTISEYFETGRCATLVGPDGAYNLYESEIRANRIITQLDQVIASLETIKENQYKAYSVLSQISRDTASISDKMTSAVKSLSEISENTAAIKETNEQIAYSTAKTAHYAKMNAELTNALGYMVAFK